MCICPSQTFFSRAREAMILSLILFATASCPQKRVQQGAVSNQPPEVGLLAEDDESDIGGPVTVSDAVIGPGDEISVNVFRHPELTSTLTVPRSGLIFLPLVGEMDILGQSAVSLRRTITEKMDRYIVDPQVSVGITVQRSQKVMVLGEVRRPGMFLISDSMTVLESIVLAGGFSEDATRRRVILLRRQGGQLVGHVLNLYRALESAQGDQNPGVRKGDIVYVPKSVVANIDRVARHLSTWLDPLVDTASVTLLGFAVKDQIEDDEPDDSSTVIIAPNRE